MPTPNKRESVTKTLISLIQADPSNRSCADCQSSLVDPSYVYASLCPKLERRQRGDFSSKIAVDLHHFALTHRAFAPPDVRNNPNFGEDPALDVNQRFGGHGLFICNKCAEAHRTLSDTITKVLAVQDASAWTKEEAQLMKNCGGNARSRLVYEAYIPNTWERKRPTPSSALEDRVVFCKAKYEALAFVMPPPGPLSTIAWLSILESNETGKRFNSSGLQNIHHLVPAFSPSSTHRDGFRASTAGEALPERLIDFFCVVSSAMQLHPREFDRDLSKLDSPEELNLWPQVADCYPSQDAHSDMLFPTHLPNFVLPNGCCPSKTQHAPTFYTFVLTLGDGDRLYGGALQIYDEHIDIEELKNLLLSSGYEGALPRFVDTESDILFLPKCLIMLSHHAFFDMFRESLLQLYRITLVEAPLPIERYIANLVSEIPLPPKGKIRVEFGFTSERPISIERPPTNMLPLANFSYRPLFASLSVGNIMVVLGCLMEECKVALLSKHFSILAPVAEALLSALFPFEWQGLYVPIMPYSMLDILDAPVPFIVGLDSRYLQEVSPERRPNNVVFVDLDRDVIHLGIDDLTDENRKVPCLPPRDALKLKARLDASGGNVYLIPNSGLKGCIMEGHGELLLVPNEDRPKYAYMETVVLNTDSLCRNEVLERTKKAYDENELLEGIAGFRTVHGQMNERSGHESDASGDSNGKRPLKRLRKPKFMRDKRAEMLQSSMAASDQAHLLDMDDPEGFSPTDIRNAFLRFMVATFENYGKFIVDKKEWSEIFDEYRFLRDLGEEREPTDFVGRILKTQMFQRFLEDRLADPDHPEIRFFDESILAKINRSKVKKMAKGGKLPTPFLEDDSGKITKTYTPPPPSNLGLPDSTEAYHYNNFPALKPSLMGRVRPPIIWDERHSQSKRMRSLKKLKIQKKQYDILARAMKPLMAPTALAAAARKSAKDLESTLSALRGIHWDKHSKSIRPAKNGKRETVDRTFRTSASGESTESERTVTTLSKADTIMMNTRRKQSILLDLVIKLQATFRMFLARLRYINYRRVVIHLQRHYRQLLSLTSAEENAKLAPKVSLAHVLAIQREVRRFIARKMIKRSKKAVATLQRQARRHIAMRRFARQKASALMIQKYLKGTRTRFAYQTTRTLVCKVQARIRGGLVRKKIQIILEGMLGLYRPEIVTLWNSSHVALSLRTRMWSAFFSRPSFTKLRVAESELWRLWERLGIDTGVRGKNVVDDTTKFSASLGIDSTTYCICHELSLFADHGTVFESLRGGLKQAYEYVEAERLQVHERLDSKAFKKKDALLYSEFGIPNGEKMKKVALARAIWTKCSLADKSQSAMIELFPELEGSLNIVFQQTSGKSKRRFPDAPKSPSTLVTNDVWESISLESLIKKHNKEVTHLYMTKVPSLMAKLDEMDKKKAERWHSMRSAMRESKGSPGLSEKERKVIHDFLYPPSNKTTKNPMQNGHAHSGDSPVRDANFSGICFDGSGTLTNGEVQVESPTEDGISAEAPAESLNFPDLI